MTWTYDETALGTSTAAERLNAVRLLVGDTDTNDQQVQDEEVTLALSECGNNIYYAGSWVCRAIASRYARYVDTDLDGQLSESFSDLQEHYKSLAKELEYQGKKSSGSIGVSGGGITNADGSRNLPKFTMDQFLYLPSNYE